MSNAKTEVITRTEIGSPRTHGWGAFLSRTKGRVKLGAYAVLFVFAVAVDEIWTLISGPANPSVERFDELE